MQLLKIFKRFRSVKSDNDIIRGTQGTLPRSFSIQKVRAKEEREIIEGKIIRSKLLRLGKYDKDFFCEYPNCYNIQKFGVNIDRGGSQRYIRCCESHKNIINCERFTNITNLHNINSMKITIISLNEKNINGLLLK